MRLRFAIVLALSLCLCLPSWAGPRDLGPEKPSKTKSAPKDPPIPPAKVTKKAKAKTKKKEHKSKITQKKRTKTQTRLSLFFKRFDWSLDVGWGMAQMKNSQSINGTTTNFKNGSGSHFSALNFIARAQAWPTGSWWGVYSDLHFLKVTNKLSTGSGESASNGQTLFMGSFAFQGRMSLYWNTVGKAQLGVTSQPLMSTILSNGSSSSKRHQQLYLYERLLLSRTFLPLRLTTEIGLVLFHRIDDFPSTLSISPEVRIGYEIGALNFSLLYAYRSLKTKMRISEDTSLVAEIKNASHHFFLMATFPFK